MSEQTLDIKFFPNDKSGSKRLGGGYISSGGLKTNFSVFSSDKSKYGFNIALPYRKNEADGKIVNEVQFVTAAVSEKAHQFIQAQLGHGGPKDDTDTSRISSNPEGKAQQKVDIKKKFNGKAPF